MFDEAGNVNCSGVTTEANLVSGAYAVSKEMHDAVDKSVYYLHDNQILTRSPRPSENHEWSQSRGNWVESLTKRKLLKSEAISNACALAIVSGFASWALDSQHYYPSKFLDQQNLAASVLASYDPDNESTWTTPFWCSDTSGEWAFVSHTASQIREVGRDAKASILAYQFKNEQLQTAIKEASTLGELDSIVW